MAATFNLQTTQQALRENALDGWLFYDFRRSNPIAHRVLNIDTHRMFTRRWFYFIPADASRQPTALVSAVEPHTLRDLPGEQKIFHSWGELHALLQETLRGSANIAMEYSPLNAIPVTSWVDAGVVELVRSFGANIISSANIAQQFEAVLTPAQIDSHRAASRLIIQAKDALFAWLHAYLLENSPSDLTEFTVQRKFMELISSQGLIFEHAPIVAINEHTGDPHYETNSAQAFPVRHGDLLLVDFTGRLANMDDSVIADYTFMTALSATVPEEAAKLFSIIVRARDTAVTFLRSRVEAHLPVMGFEADDATRAVVAEAGFAQAFSHRTGHNIGVDTHGAGANLDNLETHDDRLLLTNTCNSVEPGIYLNHIGVRTEINTLILNGAVEITGAPMQTEILPLLA